MAIRIGVMSKRVGRCLVRYVLSDVVKILPEYCGCGPREFGVVCWLVFSVRAADVCI